MHKGEIVGHVDLASLKPIPQPEPKHHWYLFSVFAMSEARLVERIGETGYYPRREVWQKRRGNLKAGESRREKKFYPVIPGYIFYNGALDDDGIYWIYNDRRFIGVRSTDGVPSRVRNEDIHRMRLAELAGSVEVSEIFSVIVGETIELVKGPYAGKIGIVREIEFGKAMLDFPLERQAAKFSVSELGKISFKA